VVSIFFQNTLLIASLVILFLTLILLLVFMRKSRTCRVAVLASNTLLSQLPEGYIALDEQGRIVDVNDVYLKLSGYSKKDLLGKDLAQAGVLDKERYVLDQLKEVVQKEPYLKEVVHHGKDGRLLPLELSVIALQEGEIAYLCIYRDISKRKKAEISLLHSHDLLRYVIEHTRSSIAVHDTSLRYIYVSQKYLDEYNLGNAESVIGRHHYDVLPDLPQKWKDVHQRALQGEVLSAEDDLYIRSNGKGEYTRWECRPWYTEAGTIGGIIIYTDMITKQKEFEQQLKQTSDYLETLFNNTNGPILVWNQAYEITRANKAFEDLMGQEGSSVVGKKVFEVFSFVDLNEQRKLLDSLVQNKTVVNDELIIPLRDGSIKTVLWSASSIFDPHDGSYIGSIAQGQDITERKCVEEENKRQLEELKRWYAVMLNREERILELKQEVNEQLKMQGKTLRYQITSEVHP
jgi:PAS domain S-box-containing protein